MAVRWDDNMIPDNRPERKITTQKLVVEEYPERARHVLRGYRDRDKFIKTCEGYIRKSREYTRYIKFLKDNLDMNRCAVLSKIAHGNGKKYSIQMHHDPFRLYDITDLEIMRKEAEGEPLNILDIARDVVKMHYEGIIGLIPLSVTQHELIDSNKCFIPLQHIYQDYHVFFERYQEFIDENDRIRDMLQAKVQLSLQCGDIQSAAADPNFVYIEAEGFSLPQVPEEWGRVIELDYKVLADEEDRKKKEEAKKAKEEAKANKVA